MKRLSILASLFLILVAGCGGGEAPATSSTTQTTTQPPAAAQAQPPAASASNGLAYDLPEGWSRVQPSSSMRLDEAAIPGSNGIGELAVFFFGPGGGGGVEANLQRWIGQMDGTGEPARETFMAGAYSITWLDLSGTMQPSSMGAGPTEPQPDYRMFAAVVEGPGGPWFFKATGPEQTMADAREDFVAMLKSVRASG